MENVFINRLHPDFKILYWSVDKEKIKNILKRVNFKYLQGAERRFRDYCSCWYYDYEPRIYIRYDGYQFSVSRQTLRKEITRRILSGENNGK